MILWKDEQIVTETHPVIVLPSIPTQLISEIIIGCLLFSIFEMLSCVIIFSYYIR